MSRPASFKDEEVFVYALGTKQQQSKKYLTIAK